MLIIVFNFGLFIKTLQKNKKMVVQVPGLEPGASKL